MSNLPHEIAPHDPKPDPQPGPSSAVEDAYQELAALLSARKRASENEDVLLKAKKENELAMNEADDAIEEVRLSLAKAIVAACPRPLPSIAEWFFSDSPLWSVQVGNRIFAAVPDNENGSANSLDEIPEKIIVVVVDVANEATVPPPPARGRFREFLATIQDDELSRYKGHGMTLDKVVEQEQENYLSGFNSDLENGVTGQAYAEANMDVAVWEGIRLVAMLRGHAGRDDGGQALRSAGLARGRGWEMRHHTNQRPRSVDPDTEIMEVKSFLPLPGLDLLVMTEIGLWSRKAWEASPESRDANWACFHLTFDRVLAMRMQA